MTLTDFRQAKAFAFRDVQREISLAYATEDPTARLLLEQARVETGGGNCLAALGLLCYTEFAGKLKVGQQTASANFNAFFDELGPAYRTFRTAHDVYDIFRCGLAHEYYVKRSCTIAMIDRGYPAGIYVDQRGQYWFIVERYFRDLQRAFDDLERHVFP